MCSSKKILIVGGNGFIGNALVKSFSNTNTEIIFTTNRIGNIKTNSIHLNLSDNQEKWEIPDDIGSAVICTGITKLEICERNIDFSHFINVEQTSKLVKLLLCKNIFTLYLSSNQVFNGEHKNTFPDSKYSPVNNYGKQKVEIEEFITSNEENWGILRLSKVLDESFPLFREWINKLETKQPITVFDDLYIAPLHIENVISVIKAILEKKQNGITQFSAESDISYFRIMENICRDYGYNHNPINKTNYKSKLNFNVPKYSTLDSCTVNEKFGFKRPSTEKTLKRIFSNIICAKC